jgi:hypothetical protein
MFSKMYWERVFKCERGKQDVAIQRAAAALTLYLTGNREGRFLVGCFSSSDESDAVELIAEDVDVEDQLRVIEVIGRLSHKARQPPDGQSWRYILVAAMRLPAAAEALDADRQEAAHPVAVQLADQQYDQT